MSSYPLDNDDSVFSVSPRTQQQDDRMLQALKSPEPLDTQPTLGARTSHTVDDDAFINNFDTASTIEQEAKKTRPLDRLKARVNNGTDNSSSLWVSTSQRSALLTGHPFAVFYNSYYCTLWHSRSTIIIVPLAVSGALDGFLVIYALAKVISHSVSGLRFFFKS